MKTIILSILIIIAAGCDGCLPGHDIIAQDRHITNSDYFTYDGYTPFVIMHEGQLGGWVSDTVYVLTMTILEDETVMLRLVGGQYRFVRYPDYIMTWNEWITINAIAKPKEKK